MRYPLRPETYDGIIERDQKSYYLFTDGEKLENEKKTLELVLNGQPNTELRQRVETRMAEIKRQLEETNMIQVSYEDLFDLIPNLNLGKRIEFLPPVDVDVVTDLLEELKDVAVEYPPALLAARRAEFKQKLAGPQEPTSRHMTISSSRKVSY